MKKLIVSCPKWVGDLVMATPALRTLRGTFPGAHIAYLCASYSADIIENAPWCDELIVWNKSKGASGIGELLRTARLLRKESFDTGVLLTNSFSSAAAFYIGGVKRRIGYSRDMRGPLLTDKLEPLRDDRGFIPVPAIKYYLEIARLLGCPADDKNMELFVDEESLKQADKIFAKYEIDNSRRIVGLNPGASFGPAKRWPAEYYAELGDWLINEMNAEVLIFGAPGERQISEDVSLSMKKNPGEIFQESLNLKVLKALVSKLDLLITNDTGTRHIACALDVPVITIFGSSDPRWTETGFSKETTLRIDVECGPCMERVCPTGEHSCMKELKPELVEEAVKKQLSGH